METQRASFSRRQFLAASAAASTGALLSGALQARALPSREAPMESADHSASWLVGTHRGLYAGAPGAPWELQGGYTLRVTSLLRQPSRTVVGGGSGVWEIRAGDNWWIQLHDETLTEVRWVKEIPDKNGFASGLHFQNLDPVILKKLMDFLKELEQTAGL